MKVDHVRELLTEAVYERAVISYILKDADNYAGKVATVRVYAKKPGGCCC